MLSGNTFLLIIFYGMAVFLAAAVVVLYLAYKSFKKHYDIQHGINQGESGGEYQILGSGGVRGMSQYDDPEAARRSAGRPAGQSGYLVSGPGVNQR